MLIKDDWSKAMNIIGTHANFSVKNLDEAVEFYKSLGFTVSHSHEGGAYLESPAGSMVEIYEKADHVPWNATVFGIEVPNVLDAVKELSLMGVKAEPVEGTDEMGIMKMDEFEAAWIKDPSGNWVCFSNAQVLK